MSDAAKVLQSMQSGLSPMDAQIFAQVTEVAKNMTPLELNRFNADGGAKLFPQLDTMNANLNTRLGVYIRQLALEMSLTADVADNPTGAAAKKQVLTEEEKAAEALVDSSLRAIEGTYGEEYRAANNNLREAEKALSAAMAEAEHAAQSPQIGHKAQRAAINAQTVAKNAVRNCANENRRLHQVYTNACRSLMAAEKQSDPLGLAPAPETAPKAPPAI